ncbi:hypothetical protein SPRG_16949 [Saprolegnia parasitica CBS 223.65]|uniref:F-box domain-containing protein n=1 Tax=Saprolegnia parasitica (strain CBS 223.65) TaxID=695850 RepID=A0A067BSJ5_SAPPC|nr:hypothetical protein SPRG_16949 [Saprolegnia parasitica CBS 223.65]KDO17632.1 hypothetical protein SPRG_16949 [Saprolegnia parasitica CBS 223.65]|eukprot:XP_012211659.1 hypothetical protein SPRG_16949 [Saprolegnia parasitica CBS 223.65]
MARETGRVGPTVVALDGVLVAIVQCTASPSDVLAFLQALVASAVELPPALSALRVLLTTPRDRKLAHLWPRVHLLSIADDEIHLVATAVSLFSSIGIDGTSRMDRWPTSNKAVGFFTDPFCAFIAPWAFKVHTLRFVHSDPAAYPSDFYELLGMCTNLKKATLACNWMALAAITTSAHQVRDLSLVNTGVKVDGPRFDWTRSLDPWLESAQTKRLRLSSFPSTDNLGLARVLATTRTLTHLHLDDANDLIRGFLANRLPLRYLTHLWLFACHDLVLADMTALLDPAVIQSIRFQSYCLEEMTGFLTALPLLTRLSVVEIAGVALGGDHTAPLPTTKTLRAAQ